MTVMEPILVEPMVVDPIEGEHDRLTHIVSPADALAEAIIHRTPVRALCGKVWVPDGDPRKYPVCQTCQDALADAALGSRGYSARGA